MPEEVQSILNLSLLIEQSFHIASRAKRFASSSFNPKGFIGRNGCKVGSEIFYHSQVQRVQSLGAIEHNLEEGVVLDEVDVSYCPSCGKMHVIGKLAHCPS